MPEKPQFKQYLGDSVYADFDGFSIVLTTENGYEATNRIVLEPNVLRTFENYQKWLIDLIKEVTEKAEQQ